MQTPELIDKSIRGECTYAYKVHMKIYDNSGNVIYDPGLSNPHNQYPYIPLMNTDDPYGYGLDTTFWVYSAEIQIPANKFNMGAMKRVELSIVDTTKKINGKCL